MPDEEVVVTTEPLSSADILSMLSSTDDKEVDTEEEEETEEVAEVEEDESEEEESEKEEDEESEEEEIKLVEEEDEDEESEEDEITVLPRRQEILKAFPDIFKKFPAIEKSLYREKKYNELFGSFDDAKDVMTKASQLDRFEADLSKGNTTPVLKAVRESNPKGFKVLVDKYLPALMETDKDAYFHVIGGVIKNAVTAMVTASKSNDDESLGEAAKVLNRFVFATDEITPHQPLVTETETDTELATERAEFAKERFETARDELGMKVTNILKGTISTHIDPKESMTAYVRKNAVRDALELVNKNLNSDKEFIRVVNRLWLNASKINYKPEAVAKIKSAFLAKAKSILPAVIKKSRSEALKGSGQSTVKKSKESPVKSGRRSITTESNNKNTNDGRGMSTYDFLNS